RLGGDAVGRRAAGQELLEGGGGGGGGRPRPVQRGARALGPGRGRGHPASALARSPRALCTVADGGFTTRSRWASACSRLPRAASTEATAASWSAGAPPASSWSCFSRALRKLARLVASVAS